MEKDRVINAKVKYEGKPFTARDHEIMKVFNLSEEKKIHRIQ